MNSLKTAAKKGIIWSFLDNVLLKGVTLIVTIILARILSPEDFGLIAIMTIFISLGNALTEGGMGNSIIRDNYATEEDFNAVFFGNLGISVMLYLLLYLTAPIIAGFFDNTHIVTFIRVFGISFVLTAFFNIQYSVLVKKMNFKKIALLNLPAVISGSIVGILCAIFNYGVWSLIYLQLSTLFFKALFYWVSSSWKPSYLISVNKLKKHIKFGYRLMLSSLIEVANREVNSFIIGKKFPVDTLGYFNQARTINSYPNRLIGTIISSVSYPLLSKLQDEKEKMNYTYAKIIRCIFFAMLPLGLILILISKPLFILVLTEKWLPSVPYFKLSVLATILAPIHAINVNIFKVFNRTDIFLKLGVIKMLLVIVSAIIGSFWGVCGLLYAMIATSCTSFFINTYYIGQFIDYTTLKQLLDFLPIIITGTASYYIVTFALDFVVISNNIFRILVGLLSFSLVYLLLLLIVKNRSLKDAIDLIKIITQK